MSQNNDKKAETVNLFKQAYQVLYDITRADQAKVNMLIYIMLKNKITHAEFTREEYNKMLMSDFILRFEFGNDRVSAELVPVIKKEIPVV